MITLKKVTILALHLGYGGIEKSIVALANLLADDYEVEIISSYQLFEKPAFDIDPRVEVRYLITRYKPNREAWKSSIKHLRPISFVKESFNSVMTLALRRSTMIRAIENCHSDIIIPHVICSILGLELTEEKVVIKSAGNTITITGI